jgi:hypothetical protein
MGLLRTKPLCAAFSTERVIGSILLSPLMLRKNMKQMGTDIQDECKTFYDCEILCFDDGEYKDDCHQGCCAALRHTICA